MAIPEACGLWIEQRVQEELDQKQETGASLHEIGRQVAAEVEKYFETKVKPGTIKERARRMQAGTNVPKPETTTATNDSAEIKQIKQQAKDGTYRGGSRPGAGRKRSQSSDDAIMDKVKEINQAIESGDISTKALEATRKALNKRDHDPQAEQEFVEQQPKKSRLRLLDDQLGGVIDELSHFADGSIEQEDGDHVWVKAIEMKGPDFIFQFHKLGIDLNQVNAAAGSPDPAADVQTIPAADNDTAQGDDLENIEQDMSLMNPEQDQAGDGDTLGDQEPEIDDAAGTDQIESDTQVDQGSDDATGGNLVEPPALVDTDTPGDEPDPVEPAQGDDDLIPDCTGRVITIEERNKYLLLVAEKYPGRSNAQERVDLLNRKGIPVYVKSSRWQYGGEWTAKRFRDNLKTSKQRPEVIPETVQVTDDPQDLPVIPEQEAVSTPASQIEKNQAGDTNQADPVHDSIDDLVPDCTDRKISIEERDEILLKVDFVRPGFKNAKARVKLLNDKRVPVRVVPDSEYGGIWDAKKFNGNLREAKKRLAKQQTNQLLQD